MRKVDAMLKEFKKDRNIKGFTLVETLVVISLMGILSLLISQTLATYSSTAADNIASHQTKVSVREMKYELTRAIAGAQVPTEETASGAIRPKSDEQPLLFATDECVIFYAYGERTAGGGPVSILANPDLVIAKIVPSKEEPDLSTLEITRWLFPDNLPPKASLMPAFEGLCKPLPTTTPTSSKGVGRSLSTQPILVTGDAKFSYTPENLAPSDEKISGVNFTATVQNNRGDREALKFSVTLPTAFYEYFTSEDNK